MLQIHIPYSVHARTRAHTHKHTPFFTHMHTLSFSLSLRCFLLSFTEVDHLNINTNKVTFRQQCLNGVTVTIRWQVYLMWSTLRLSVGPGFSQYIVPSGSIICKHSVSFQFYAHNIQLFIFASNDDLNPIHLTFRNYSVLFLSAFHLQLILELLFKHKF